MFHSRIMRIDETTIAHAILAAPGWVRVGISAPTEHMREDAASELARVILSERGKVAADPNQLKLSL